MRVLKRSRPSTEFDIISIDFPWSYNSKKAGGSMNSGAAQKYDVMTLKEILGLPIQGLFAKDCVLLLWVTSPLKFEVVPKILECFGFKYKATYYWRKERNKLGMGWWFRGDVEECIVAVKGHPKPFRSSARNWLDEPPTQHSRKPEKFYDIIDKISTGRKLELFATRKRPGWTCFGRAVSGEDIRVSIAKLGGASGPQGEGAARVHKIKSRTHH